MNLSHKILKIPCYLSLLLSSCRTNRKVFAENPKHKFLVVGLSTSLFFIIAWNLIVPIHFSHRSSFSICFKNTFLLAFLGLIHRKNEIVSFVYFITHFLCFLYCTELPLFFQQHNNYQESRKKLQCYPLIK